MTNPSLDASWPADWSDADEKTFQVVQQNYMPPVLKKIRQAALDNRTETETAVTFENVFDAFRSVFGPPAAAVAPKPPGGFGHFVRENLFLIVTVLLALAFGILAKYPVAVAAGSGAQSYLDIVKIFAGAIVGGAATSAVTSRGSKKG